MLELGAEFRDGERWAWFGRIVLVMTSDMGLGDVVHVHKLEDEALEGSLLLWGTGILCLVGRVWWTTTYIDNAYGTGVVVGAMGSYGVDVTSNMDRTITIDDIVVADIRPATSTFGSWHCMPVLDVRNGIISSLFGCCAVEDEFIYLTRSIGKSEGAVRIVWDSISLFQDNAKSTFLFKDFPTFRTTNAIRSETMGALPVAEYFIGQLTKDAILMKMEELLKSADGRTFRAFFDCLHN